MIFGGLELFILLFLLLGVGVFLFLRSREQQRAGKGQPVLATWRLALASFAALVLLFSGGCSLVFLPEAVTGNPYIDPMAILMIGGVPFAVALLIWWLSMRRPSA
ncbi:MAG: hypothetical protein HC855_05795 [Rhizobiales bacterium]|nr:hypothetical protein [Hyphomicrobiales bacterium]